MKQCTLKKRIVILVLPVIHLLVNPKHAEQKPRYFARFHLAATFLATFGHSFDVRVHDIATYFPEPVIKFSFFSCHLYALIVSIFFYSLIFDILFQ